MSSENKKNIKKPILKKIGTFFLCLPIIACLLEITAFGWVNAREKIETTRYEPATVVSQYMENYEVENVYTLNSKSGLYKRLGHNGIEPVYVSFDKGYDSNPKYKEFAIKSLDYIFGIVSKINPKYKYKVVAESTRHFEEIMGRSTIQFITEDFESTGRQKVNGEAQHKNYFYDNLVWDYITKKNVVSVDFSHFETLEDDYIKYVYAHELMHIFGFKDVYDKQIIDGQISYDDVLRLRGDTFIDSNVGREIKIITPSDFATLCALYRPNVSDKKQAGEDERIEKLIREYTEYYYSVTDKRVFEHLPGVSKLLKGKSITPMEDVEEITLKRGAVVDLKSEDFELVQNYIKIKIKDGRYTLNLYDESGKLLDSCDGKVQKTEHFVILENCEFKKGVFPNVERLVFEDKYIANIMLFECEGKYAYFDMENWLTFPTAISDVKTTGSPDVEKD